MENFIRCDGISSNRLDIREKKCDPMGTLLLDIAHAMLSWKVRTVDKLNISPHCMLLFFS